ncbi:MAG TPA: S9 family peptidase [Candidatus Eremiobacteraceae bacterium]|nr:S9 family peptidase [Candidatus Eremiobacteraceae bacterium]
MRFFIGLAFLVLVTVVPFGAHARTIVLSDLRHVVNVTNPRISPDGKQIACVVSRSNFAKNDDDMELLLVDIASGAQRTLIRGRHGVSSPQWSPGGDRIAFIARESDQDSAEDQVYVMPVKGGSVKQISNAPNGVDVFAWRPDGSAIAYVTADVPPNKRAIEQGHDYFEVGNDPYLTTAAPTSLHIWLVPANGGHAQRITSGSWSIATPDVSVPLSWSPDGREIVIPRVSTPHTGDGDHSTIAVIDVTTKKLRKLTSRIRFEDYPMFSPDGSKIAYVYSLNGDDMNEGNVFVSPAKGGDGFNAHRNLDRDVNGALWMPDSTSLLIGAPDETRTSLWLQPLDGPARKLDLGDVDPSNDSGIDMTVGNDGAIAFSGYTHVQPTELYYMSSSTASPRRLTDFNHEIALLDLGNAETITWKTFDGFTADGVLTYPPGYVKGKKYPLVLRIHGGPNEGSNTDFYDYIQLVAAHGYLVFQPNYRGSDNLGNAFMHITWNDGGDGPGRDIMAGLAAVEKLGIVDTSRVALGGWSNGGYMTSWLISHYPGWKAAVLGAAYTDCLEDYNLSDSNVSDVWYFKGSPWVDDHMSSCREQSSITYWKHITTPTLIFSNTGDVRVPITQSYAIYHALKDNHVPVKFIAWPESGHEVSGPVRIEDLYRIWLDWLDHYLK